MGQFPPAEIRPLEISVRRGKRHCRQRVTRLERRRGPRHSPVTGSSWWPRGGSEGPVLMLSPSGVACTPDAAGGHDWEAVLFYNSNKKEIGESI